MYHHKPYWEEQDPETGEVLQLPGRPLSGSWKAFTAEASRSKLCPIPLYVELGFFTPESLIVRELTAGEGTFVIKRARLSAHAHRRARVDASYRRCERNNVRMRKTVC